MPQDTQSLSGKLALVTGAGTGIGRGVAVELARQGADVALHYASSADGAISAVSEIQALGRRAVALQADLGNVDECRRVVDAAARFLGGLDALVNNAGVTLIAKFLDTTAEQFDRIYGINIRSHYFCAQQAVPHLIARGNELTARGAAWAGGSIVNVSSVHAFAGAVGHTVYAGTKGAIDAFTRGLSAELSASHIRVNAIGPGVIEVPRYFDSKSGYTHEKGNSMVPWGRAGMPEDVAHLVAFLASDASEFITGQVIFIDGGMTAQMCLPE